MFLLSMGPSAFRRSGVRISPKTSLKISLKLLGIQGFELLILPSNNTLKIPFHHFEQNEKDKACDQF
ncbi:hypothetical protein DI291_0585 [Bacillus paralicheniformis]|nr:hypothetical protein DI291_0585 [Bacillus paralicheniformis]